MSSFPFNFERSVPSLIVDSLGPSPFTNQRSAPSACGKSNISANKIEASKP